MKITLTANCCPKKGGPPLAEPSLCCSLSLLLRFCAAPKPLEDEVLAQQSLGFLTFLGPLRGRFGSRESSVLGGTLRGPCGSLALPPRSPQRDATCDISQQCCSSTAQVQRMSAQALKGLESSILLSAAAATAGTWCKLLEMTQLHTVRRHEGIHMLGRE